VSLRNTVLSFWNSWLFYVSKGEYGSVRNYWVRFSDEEMFPDRIGRYAVYAYWAVQKISDDFF
jgi:hypothetical protein